MKITVPELHLLPDEARQELMNYYNYLIWKYVRLYPSDNEENLTLKKAEPRISELPDVFYHPIVTDKYLKISRDEIYEND